MAFGVYCLNFLSGCRNRFENCAVLGGKNVTGNLASSAPTFESVRRRLQVHIGYRGTFFFFCKRICARQEWSLQKGTGFEGEEEEGITGDRLNVHFKFRLNGISIHTAYVPEGNLPSVVLVSGWTRGMREAGFRTVRNHWSMGVGGRGCESRYNAKWNCHNNHPRAYIHCGRISCDKYIPPIVGAHNYSRAE